MTDGRFASKLTEHRLLRIWSLHKQILNVSSNSWRQDPVVGCWNSNKPLGNLLTEWMYTLSLIDLYPMEFNLWIHNEFLTPGNRLITTFKLSLQTCFYQLALRYQLLNKAQSGVGWQNCATCNAHTDFQHYNWCDILWSLWTQVINPNIHLPYVCFLE
jgi:hypothetical protein